MQRERFDEYIRRFNKQDETAFEDFLSPTMRMKNGTLEYTGVDGMKNHYRNNIWGTFDEWLDVRQFVSDDHGVAIQMFTRFTATRDEPNTIFGPVTVGELFEFNGVIIYRLDETDRFADIIVAYNSFEHIDLSGARVDLGIPH